MDVRYSSTALLFIEADIRIALRMSEHVHVKFGHGFSTMWEILKESLTTCNLHHNYLEYQKLVALFLGWGL